MSSLKWARRDNNKKISNTTIKQTDFSNDDVYSLNNELVLSTMNSKRMNISTTAERINTVSIIPVSDAPVKILKAELKLVIEWITNY